jgi:hypothetical protein
MVCPICLSGESTEKNHPTRDAVTVVCLQCGEFLIATSAVAALRSAPNASRWKLSAWIREFSPSMVGSSDVDRGLESVAPSLTHRADRMLRWIVSAFPPGTSFSLNDLGKWKALDGHPGVLVLGGAVIASPLVPIGWNRTVEEMQFMVTEVLCNELEHLTSEDNREYQVSPKGLLYLEGRRSPASATGFCAMWFSQDVQSLWSEVIEPAIRESGYEPLRIDSKQHNGKIDDEIMASIRSARFVVSDFTGNRGGVYYEAGFAHGLGLPVIFMCQAGDELHFDVRQYNCIFWAKDQLEDARTRLKNRILATLGQGPLQLH